MNSGASTSLSVSKKNSTAVNDGGMEAWCLHAAVKLEPVCGDHSAQKGGVAEAGADGGAEKDARAAARRAKKARQKANKAERKAAAAAASEAERADYPHAQLRENVEIVMEGLEAAAQAARNPSGSNIQVAYSLPPEGGSGFGDLVYATVPLGSVATKVARDWLANELYEPSRSGKIDAACRDRKVADLITAAGASAPADAVFGGRFATGEAPRPTTPASEADEGDGVGGDGGTGIEHFDLFEPDLGQKGAGRV
ncbi:hypothetical protein EMIHUDRAFT_229249 [Emiliania huxleyi CCMP1516]|uniref:Uncharacterized protein n=2 Tax=Emiliania huxleyi TaxID=2903 RepID=A0A0D3KDC1_EMIH1|nr:hypothetical protein EMIHUDRAFT_229249 [Emiliania huxleyi CCMP1516]EOD33756.1 hypothetical protein EMIHUDRAFT_229249 [Emiliania huxleyi CCMP1516]|eukprot:XP_005786185.1 hypothetical protein EMIHUDRAFT_229249 [Emiliania huxleyi CCMP1516]